VSLSLDFAEVYPLGHSVQALAPFVLEYLPSGHEAQTELCHSLGHCASDVRFTVPAKQAKDAESLAWQLYCVFWLLIMHQAPFELALRQFSQLGKRGKSPPS
jgi:hypothetical protein